MSRRLHITQKRTHGLRDAHFVRNPSGEAATVGANLGTVNPRQVGKSLRVGGMTDAQYIQHKSRNPRR